MVPCSFEVVDQIIRDRPGIEGERRRDEVESFGDESIGVGVGGDVRGRWGGSGRGGGRGRGGG